MHDNILMHQKTLKPCAKSLRNDDRYFDLSQTSMCFTVRILHLTDKTTLTKWHFMGSIFKGFPWIPLDVSRAFGTRNFHSPPPLAGYCSAKRWHYA